MSTPEHMAARPMEPIGSRPAAIGRTAINEFRKARAQFRAERAAADQAAEDGVHDDGRLVAGRSSPDDHVPTAAELVVLAHGEPLSLALTRRRRDESASLDRRLRLSRLVARKGRVAASIAELATIDGTIDLRDGAEAGRPDDALAPVVDLRPRPASPRVTADADTPVI
jgi:hypothetical protein